MPNRDPQREYVAGSGAGSPLTGSLRALPVSTDRLQGEFGVAIFEEMTRDDAVDSAVSYLVDGVLSEGVRLEPAVEPPQPGSEPDPARERDAADAATYREFVARSFEDLPGGIETACEAFLRAALVHGHVVGETPLRPGSGVDAGKLVLASLKAKLDVNLALVVDEYDNLLGVSAVIPGETLQAAGADGLTYDGPARVPGFIPRSRLAFLRNRSRKGDPRGVSALVPAYNAWWLKRNTAPDYYRYLKQFATPTVVATAAPESQGTVTYNPDGSVKTTADGMPVIESGVAKLEAAVQGFMGAGYLVGEHGFEAELLYSQGEGRAFIVAHDSFDRHIHMAILGTARATLEAEHGSRADSGTAQDVVGLRVSRLRRSLARMLYEDVSRYLIAVNFGEEAARLAPRVVLSAIEQQDQTEYLRGLASVGYAIHPSQFAGIDARLGLPARDADAVAADAEETRLQARLLAAETGKLRHPGEEMIEGGDGEGE